VERNSCVKALRGSCMVCSQKSQEASVAEGESSIMKDRRDQSDSGASKCSLVGPCKAYKLRKSEVTGSSDKRSDMICVIFDRVGRLGKETDQIGKINRETSQRL